MRGSLFAALVAVLAMVAVAGPAGAVDDTKPSPCVGGLTVKDPAGDMNAVNPAAEPEASDVLNFFSKFDPAKGAEAATFNFHVKNLALEIPDGWTSLTWQVIYKDPDGTARFVRAVLDFSGDLSYEYGDFQDLQATNTSVYRGDTVGKTFEGPDGVLQIVLPADRGGTAGNKLTDVFAETRIGRQVPNALSTPSRGLANTLDSVPDTGVEAGLSLTQTPCSAGTPAPVTPPGGGPTPPSGGQPTGERALPVTLVTKSISARKSKKAAKLKLRSSEKVTNLGAQLKRGKKVVGKGRLAQLNGNGTLTIKKPKGLKKGSYILDLVGEDAQGAKRFVSYKVKVKK